MQTFRNALHTARRSDRTNVVAVVGESAPAVGQWIALEGLEAELELEGLTLLYRQAGRAFYGHL